MDFIRNSKEVYEGFFSSIYFFDNYAFKILKRYSEKEKEILEQELKLGLQFSPRIYKKIISFKYNSRIRYALQMYRIDGNTLTEIIKQMRRLNKNFLNSRNMESLLKKILKNLIAGYKRGNLLSSKICLSRTYIKNYFEHLINTLKNYDILKNLNILIHLQEIKKLFDQSLDNFIQNFKNQKVPINHGDLNSNNILIPFKEQNIILIDPYPEILNEIQLKHNIINPKGFSFFYDLVCLKLSISSFQGFKESFSIFNEVINNSSYFSNFLQTDTYMNLWELLVTIRKLVIFYFNFEENFNNNNPILEENLNFSLFQRYGKKLSYLCDYK